MPQRFKSGYDPSFRRRGAQALADLVSPSIGPVLARQGFGESDVLMHWPDIVGADLAERCHPLKLQWRTRTRSGDGQGPPATLVVRVDGAFALTLQHMGPVIIERVNAHLGWACVGRLALRQGPLPPARTRLPTRGAIDPEAARRAEVSTGSVQDDDLRAALTRLGSRILTRASRPQAGRREK